MKMQQTKSYWRVVAVAGVVIAFVGAACSVTTSTDDSADGEGGTTVTTTGGSAGAVTAGGTTSVAGTTSIAGTTGVGGAGAVSFQCDPLDQDAGIQGTPASCAADSSNTCSVCIAAHCCTEFSDCYATNPGNQCGFGGPDGKGTGEIACVQACIQAATSDGGVLDDTTIETCSNGCVTPKDTAQMTCQQAIGTQTSDLIGCMNMNCQTDCLGG
jgi:hypothetical protein